MKEEIGKRITKIRQDMFMNKEQFAHLIGMSGQYLGNVEKGINGLTLEKAIIICEKAHVSADYLLFGKEEILDEKLNKLLDEVNAMQISKALEAIRKLAMLIKYS